MKKKLFVDMDGVLAEWKNMTIPSQVPTERIKEYVNDVLYTENYYYNLQPYQNMVNAIKDIIKENKVDVYIMSCYLPDNEKYPNSHPLEDKNKWLDEYFGDLLPKENRIFVLDGEPKIDNLPEHIKLNDNDVLLDDYNKNLTEWVERNPKLKGIKVLNGINDKHHSWNGKRVKILDESIDIKKDIYKTMDTNEVDHDKIEKCLGKIKEANYVLFQDGIERYMQSDNILAKCLKDFKEIMKENIIKELGYNPFFEKKLSINEKSYTILELVDILRDKSHIDDCMEFFKTENNYNKIIDFFAENDMVDEMFLAQRNYNLMQEMEVAKESYAPDIPIDYTLEEFEIENDEEQEL